MWGLPSGAELLKGALRPSGHSARLRADGAVSGKRSYVCVVLRLTVE